MFDFVPDALLATDLAVEVDNAQVKRSVVNDTYRRCIYAVYGQKWPAQGLGQRWEDVVRNAKEADMPLETFIGTVIVAYKITHPRTAFPVNNLTAESSVSKVKMYERICREKYGYNNLEALGLLIDEKTQTIENELLHSEITVGRYIIGWLLRKGGGIPYCELYENHELTRSLY